MIIIFNGGTSTDWRLPKAIKTEWLNALRSGEFEQGCGVLCVSDKKGNNAFCCLGVYAHLFDPEPWVKHTYVLNSKPDAIVWSTSVGDIANISEDAIPEEIQCKLTGLNDGGKSFKQIADWIEKNL